MFNIEEELKKIPGEPGTYIMKNKEDEIIYIGKANNLRVRVRQYFRKTEKTERIKKMVSQIDHFEYIVVDNQAEALLLECNLIKENKPKFNILLKDDKGYPYIKVNLNSDYPTVTYTKRKTKDGARYFGPYASAGSAKELINFIREKYQIRQCKTLKKMVRPCLNYNMKKCLAPCMKYCTREEYMIQVNEILDLLEGKIDKIVKELDIKMGEAARLQDYEKAAKIRDKKNALINVSQKQKMSNINENEIDVIGMVRENGRIAIIVFLIRGSKMIDKKQFIIENDITDDREIVSGFMKQFYLENPNIPNKILIKERVKDTYLIGKMLELQAGRKVEIKYPQKGEKLKLVEMAEGNARLALKNTKGNTNELMEELKKVLELERIPQKIETYDISNLSGENIVGAMCVMLNGEIRKELSRRFKIRTLYNQDDIKSTNEMVFRRFSNLEEKHEGFGELPDIIFADGGINQINAIKEAIQRAELDLPYEILVFGMVKDDSHRTRALINDKREEISVSEELMKLITRFQDTVHETAINYHRKIRDAKMSSSSLDLIKGIGEQKKKALLQRFGSVEGIRNATDKELKEVKGITILTIQQIRKKI